MSRRRNRGSIAGYADWQVEFLRTGALPPEDTPDINVFDRLDYEYPQGGPRCRVLKAWCACRNKIMADWRDPATRPYGWWLFDSGIKRKRDGAQVFSLRDSLPEDRRAWLVEHGHLSE